MVEAAQSAAVPTLFDRERLRSMADCAAVAVALSLPWSTSLTGVFVGVWAVVLAPTLDWRMLRGSLDIPAAALPVALCLLAVVGTAWSDAAFSEQFSELKAYLRFLAIPLLLLQFQRSGRGHWVALGFLASSTVLLGISWMHVFVPALAWPSRFGAGVPVKDYTIQSSEFLICGFALAHMTLTSWRAGRAPLSMLFGILALVFFANISFVAIGRGTLVAGFILLGVFVFQRFSPKHAAAIAVLALTAVSCVTLTSPYLRSRIADIQKEMVDYRGGLPAYEASSVGYRVEFWTKAMAIVARSPIIGHGTGSTREMYQQAAGRKGLAAAVTDNPHNQTLIIAIPLGLLGTALLFAVWIAHLRLFRPAGLAGWIGLGVVVQNMVAGLFNVSLFEFTMGWFYIFAVGVLGGIILRERVPGRSGIEAA